MLAKRTFRWIYAGLWVLRICFALLGAAYIHPDEHMQNGEVTSGDLLSYHTIRTWEWSTAFPLRSVVTPFMTTGIPILCARFFLDKEHLTQGIRPILLFRLERFAFLVISGLVDYSLMALIHSPRDRRLGALLLAFSHVTNTFQVRPFSNSIEAVLVSLSLVLLYKVTILKKSSFLYLLAVIFVIGTFNRPTFLIFGAPIAYQVAFWTLRSSGTVTTWLRLVVGPLFTAVAMCATFLAADTIYFRGTLDGPVVTPFNFIKYNFSSHNLADHGLHPRWLHVFVNLPMLVGPWVLWLAVCTIVERPRSDEKNGKLSEVDVIRQTIIQMIVVSLAILSVQPHQEPRFLAPLVLPIIILIANSGRLARVGKAFWVSCSIFNLVLAIVFGFLHQGGVVPSLIYLHSVIDNTSVGIRTNIIYWKTYMPPLHFLGVSEQAVLSGVISFTDLAGAPQGDFAICLAAARDRTFIVTPMAMWHTLPPTIANCMELDKSIFPHLDLDHISESIEAGALEGLRLGVYTLSPDCISV